MKEPKPWKLRIFRLEDDSGEPSEANFETKTITINPLEIQGDTTDPLFSPEAELAHEIAHTKIETEGPTPYAGETENEYDTRRRRGEYRARAYTYIKNWAGAKTIQDLMRLTWGGFDFPVDEEREHLRYRVAAHDLLGRKKITRKEYNQFLEDLEKELG